MVVAIKPREYAKSVRGQYEDLPYPMRDPEQEGRELHFCDPNSLLALSHYGWGGRRDLRQGGRILSAGCGTGDAPLMFAEELLGHDAEIVAIDLSAKSLEIAQARAKKRGLTNIRFEHLSILDVPNAGLGMFDAIESSGVLHHLPDPSAGLRSLAQVLKDDGIMTVMVYGQYGRMSVYLVQALMQQLMAGDTPRAEKIAIAREFLNYVPSQHWITVNNAAILPDLKFEDGSGIYDLFLHSTDRAYTVPELYAWVEGCGLQLTSLFSDSVDESLYSPQGYTPSTKLHAIFAQKSLREQQMIAELMHGNIGKHSFYATKQTKTPAMFDDSMVIAYGPMQSLFMEFVEGFIPALEAAPIGQRVEGRAKGMASAAVPNLLITKQAHTVALMRAIDGTRSIGDIVAAVAASASASPEEVRAQLALLYKEYRARQVVFLRHASVAPYITGAEVMARVKRVIGR